MKAMKVKRRVNWLCKMVLEIQEMIASWLVVKTAVSIISKVTARGNVVFRILISLKNIYMRSRKLFFRLKLWKIAKN